MRWKDNKPTTTNRINMNGPFLTILLPLPLGLNATLHSEAAHFPIEYHPILQLDIGSDMDLPGKVFPGDLLGCEGGDIVAVKELPKDQLLPRIDLMIHPFGHIKGAILLIQGGIDIPKGSHEPYLLQVLNGFDPRDKTHGGTWGIHGGIHFNLYTGRRDIEVPPFGVQE